MQSTKAFSSLMQSLKPDLTSLRVLTENQQDPDVVYDPTEGANWVQRGLIFRKPDNTLIGVYQPFKDTDTTIVIPDVNAGDKLWAHWENPNTYQDVGSTDTAFSNANYTLTQGELTTSQYPHVPAGLYRFTAEVALVNYTVYAGRSNVSIQLKYGANVLRAQAYLFDRSIDCDNDPNAFAQTAWFGGVFRMASEGDIAIVAKMYKGITNAAKMKCSHLFVNRIGE